MSLCRWDNRDSDTHRPPQRELISQGLKLSLESKALQFQKAVSFLRIGGFSNFAEPHKRWQSVLAFNDLGPTSAL